ncbi:Oxysterol-binding protein-domain-containing protein [Leptodontidium sp. MPI-SDFR-AT-0119]|nr:Oxysterol-binding protein-domain-containing protein [Leptodontidium sp. MPI-SDFR-AT-0119]
MAGLEQLEIHSKSYIVRWVKVDEGHTISWSVQPHKKSINFGIFKHPGTSNAGTPIITPAADDAPTSLSHLDPSTERQRRSSSARNDASTAQDQLRAKGFIAIQWHGKCEADKVSMGTYAVLPGNGGMYGLVFDNTFSKQISKTATFVLLTYPSNAPPHATHHQQGVPGSMSTTGIGGIGKNSSPKLGATASDSVDSLQSHLVIGNTGSRGNSIVGRESDNGVPTYHVGVLSKRRRKRGQGYARRFFSLDFASCTLSYYYSRNSSALRGAIPLSLAAIAADERRREISIDSGAEIWHLKAGTAKDFEDWTKALETASNTARGVEPEPTPSPERLRVRTSGLHAPVSNQEDEREWEQVEALVSRIVGTRDAVRRLCKDTAPGGPKRNVLQGLGLAAPSPSVDEGTDYFGSASAPEKRPFWKRKSSAPSTPRMFQQGISSQLAVPAPTTVTTVSANGSMTPSSRRNRRSLVPEESMHDHCSALLNDLDAVLNDFSTLLSNSKRRRIPAPLSSISRNSIDSTSTGEFYDAEPGDIGSQLLMIDRRSEEDTQPSEAEDEFVSDASSISSVEDEYSSAHLNGKAALFPVKPKNLDPLPISTAIRRRQTVPAATVMPPSLIGFLRKNVGKDLSTISMPVSANEPLSLLQRVAEQLEYAQILNTAASQKAPLQRLLHVTAFAVSQFSTNRAKERAIRKPFNPMLGETYELVRSESDIPGGFRVLVEKVSHRPVRMACQADSARWSLSQSPAPTQKFWGKSAELITEGRVRLVLRLPDGGDEFYSWNVATVFLRNVVVGEKYVEPVGNMTVTNETAGSKATVEFKQKGMFGGRSEEVQVETYSSDGAPTGLGLVGNWTSSLQLSEGGKAKGPEIWHVGDLVDNAPQKYGFTTFAAGLNELTELEKGKLPITDCRLRPDQRAAETGDLDTAELLKAKLEEAQRTRRKEMEQRGDIHKPRWFTRIEGGDEGEEVWKLKGGKEGYWEERSKGQWTGVEDILAQ